MEPSINDFLRELCAKQERMIVILKIQAFLLLIMIVENSKYHTGWKGFF